MTAAAEGQAFYTPKQVASVTGLSYKTVLEQIHDGAIPAEKFGTLYKVPARWVREQQGVPTLSLVPDPAPAVPDYGPIASVLEILGAAMVEAAGALRGRAS